MAIIYISGPYSKGDVTENVRRACFAGNKILGKGHTPFIPHLTHLWHLLSPKPWETWLQIDLALLSVCDAVLRLDGESRGADIEVKYAKRLNIPIYTSLEDIPNENLS